MRRPTRTWVPFVTVLALAGCVLLAACGSSSNSNNAGSPVVSTTTLPGATVNVAYTASLSATGGTAPYTWSVTTGSLPAGLMLSGSTISGTPTTAGTSMFTVQVTDAASRTGTAPLSITVSPQSPLSITTTSLPGGYVSVPYSATLGATGGVPPYTWSVPPGTLPVGLTLAASTGVISGTPTANGTSSFTADVTDSQSNMASAQLQITINPALSNSALSGNYAFSLSGYQTVSSQQVPFFMAGSFVADGAGNLQGGVLDMNSSSGQQVDVSFTGMYSVSGNGIATMTFVTSATTYSLSAIVSSGGNGQLILNNTDPAPRGSGTFFLQNTQDFQVPPAASYAIGTLGADSSLNRYAAAGQFVVGSGGVLTSSTEDVNDNGTLTTGRTFTGSFGAPNASTGRGVVGFTFNGVLNSYAYYVISNGQYILVGIDPLADNDPLTITSMLTQTGTYSNASLTGNSILELTGLTSNNADVVLGLATWDGNGNGTFSLDENAGGTITTQQMSQGTYTVESDGRVAVMNSSGSTIDILYLSNTNQAFVLGQDASVKAGVLEPQTAVPPYSNSSIFGTYLGGTVNPAQSPIVDASGYFLADGNGNLSGMESTSGPSGPGTLSLSATYQVDSTGRAVLTGTPAGFMYVVSPKKVVLLPMGNAPALSVFNIGLTN